jgi:hypothetical protein
MAQKRTATARSEAFGLFKDKEMDWAFRRTLEFMIEKAAEIGECLFAARRIDETDFELLKTFHHEGTSGSNQLCNHSIGQHGGWGGAD